MTRVHRKKEKRLFALTLYFLLIIPAVFGQLHTVANESTIHFTIHNFGFKTGGSLAAPEEISYLIRTISPIFFHVSIKTESINTDNESRDEHLKEDGYFDVKYPLIRYSSSSIRATGKKDSYETRGTLTIKETSREISIPFQAVKNGNGWSFTGGFIMNRKDYGVGGSSTLSTELTVDINVIAR